MKPQIVTPEAGAHNADLERAGARLVKGCTFQDCSTICLTPTRGTCSLSGRWALAWRCLLAPMNQKFHPWLLLGFEVGDAFSQAVEQILTHPDLSKWKYVLTFEDDNLPPADGLLKLIEAIEGKAGGGPYDAVGGLYWTKGEGGQPMCYGRTDVMPKNFVPWLPAPDSVAPCNGLGMGFTLFRLSMLKDPQLPRPLFKTTQELIPGQGVRCYTQDLAFFENAGRAGYRFACDTRVKVGHYDHNEDRVW